MWRSHHRDGPEGLLLSRCSFLAAPYPVGQQLVHRCPYMVLISCSFSQMQNLRN